MTDATGPTELNNHSEKNAPTELDHNNEPHNNEHLSRRDPGTRTALVVEGGAMRGIFSTGVLDSFLAEDFHPFDICIGVSAGANNLVSFLAGARERSYTIYTHLSPQPQFINIRRFVTGGHLMDLDWLWDMSMRDLPINVDRVIHEGPEYVIGLTRVRDGQIVFRNPDTENLAEMLKASSAMPLFYRRFVTLDDGEDYVDGGLAEPIPVEEARRRGAGRILVLRSRPYSFRMNPRKRNRLMQAALRDYPALRHAFAHRSERYNRAVDFIRNPPEGVHITEINPPEEFETSRMTRDVDALNRDYRRGIEQGREIVRAWQPAIA